MHFAVLRVRLSTAGQHRLRGWTQVLVTFLVLLISTTAAADEPSSSTVGESERGMPGLVSVAVPRETSTPLVAAVGAGYGFMDETQAVEGGHRLRGSLGAAYAPAPAVLLGLDILGRWDNYSSGGASEINLYGEPRLSGRYSHGLGPSTVIGAEANVRLIGGEAPSIRLEATTPTLLALLSTSLSPTTWLAVNLGFQLDRSAKAIPDPAVLSPADERTLGASSWNSVPWGIGVSHSLSAAELELMAEISGEVLVGSNAPGIARSPYRASIGARKPVTDSISVMASADVGLSRRTAAGDDLMNIEPRFGIGAALLWHWGKPEPAPEPPAPPPEPAPAPPPVVETPSEPVAVTSPVTGRVVDEGGRPLPDVEVTLTLGQDAPRVERTFADGAFRFEEVPQGSVELRVDTPGYDAATVNLPDGEARTTEVMLRPAVPAGQVRGRVLDLKGRPLKAEISISPGEHEVAVGDDGSFELELAPGSYVVEFRHDGHTTQKRKIVVANRGVVILNIALTK